MKEGGRDKVRWKQKEGKSVGERDGREMVRCAREQVMEGEGE